MLIKKCQSHHSGDLFLLYKLIFSTISWRLQLTEVWSLNMDTLTTVSCFLSARQKWCWWTDAQTSVDMTSAAFIYVPAELKHNRKESPCSFLVIIWTVWSYKPDLESPIQMSAPDPCVSTINSLWSRPLWKIHISGNIDCNMCNCSMSCVHV